MNRGVAQKLIFIFFKTIFEGLSVFSLFLFVFRHVFLIILAEFCNFVFVYLVVFFSSQLLLT